MKLKIAKQDIVKEQLKIPKGHRLLEDWEAFNESRTNKELNQLMKDTWIWVNTPNGIKAAGLGYSGDEFHVYGYYGLTGRSRGVFVKIERPKP